MVVDVEELAVELDVELDEELDVELDVEDLHVEEVVFSATTVVRLVTSLANVDSHPEPRSPAIIDGSGGEREC